ncbi:MAG: FkbM family methyltransferase [Cephaloticoccus sp.]|nr:FkbM family methyltransferase [Cephaloticoccus sp.]
MPTLRNRISDILRKFSLVGRTDDKAEILRCFNLLRLPKHVPGSISWHGQCLRYADGPALYHQLTDIYVDHCYDFYCANTSPRILDVGGHIGLASLRFREQFPDANITVFEPDPALVVMLRSNLAMVNSQGTQVVASAAWTYDGEIGFQITGDDSGGIREDATCLVKCIDLASYCTTKVDYLKLDIEGAEFTVLDHLYRTGSLTQVQRVFIELHAWEPGTPPKFHQIFLILAEAGFDYRIRSAQIFPSGVEASLNPNQTANLVTVFAWRPEQSHLCPG